MPKDISSQRGFIHLLALVLLLIGIGIGIYLVQHPQIFKPKASESNINKPYGKIIVQGRKLIDSDSGKEFIVRSNQFADIVYTGTTPNQQIFTPQVFSDGSSTQREFKKMAELGYNTIRLVYGDGETTDYISGETGPQGWCKNTSSDGIENCIRKSTLENLVKTINYAKENNLKVMLTLSGYLPLRYNSDPLSATSQYNNQYPPGYQNQNVMRPQTVKDYRRYIKDVLAYLEGKVDFDTILAVQPKPEPAIDTLNFPFRKPIDNCQGNGYSCKFQTLNTVIDPTNFQVSRTYQVNEDLLLADSQGHNSEEMKKLIYDVFSKSFNEEWFPEIKAKGLLTAYDQFLQYAVKDPNDGRRIEDSFVTGSNLQADIVGIQMYPPFSSISDPAESLDTALNTYLSYTPNLKEQIQSINKPFLVWEMGVDKNDSEPLDRIISWQKQTCVLNPQGWNLFYWTRVPNNHSSLDASYNTNYQDYALANVLSPNLRPDPCTDFISGQRTGVNSITASSSHLNNPPNLAIDGNPNTDWNSGSNSPQYIDLDLGEGKRISALKLLTSQVPSGQTPKKTSHKICVGLEDNSFEFCPLILSSQTVDNQWLTTYKLSQFGAIRYIRIQTDEHPDWPAWREIEVYGLPQLSPIPTPEVTPIYTPTPTPTPKILQTPQPSTSPSPQATLLPTPKPTSRTVKSSDLNNDGVTNMVDYGIFISYWRSKNLAGDLNGDGKVNGNDMSIMLSSGGIKK